MFTPPSSRPASSCSSWSTAPPPISRAWRCISRTRFLPPDLQLLPAAAAGAATVGVGRSAAGRQFPGRGGLGLEGGGRCRRRPVAVRRRRDRLASRRQAHRGARQRRSRAAPATPERRIAGSPHNGPERYRDSRIGAAPERSPSWIGLRRVCGWMGRMFRSGARGLRAPYSFRPANMQ